MDHDRVEEELRAELARDYYNSGPDGHYGPSQVSGCPLRIFLDGMTDHEDVMNSWMFQGTAVHYYLQESGRLTKLLKNAGYHPGFIDYEVNTRYQVTDEVWINGTCDILIEHEGKRIVYDIKYSSLPVDSGHGRFYKYFSQANAYAHMFNADEYGLMLIRSTSKNLPDDAHIMGGELSEENWEKVQKKAVAAHNALKEAGHYDGVEWTPEELTEKGPDFWKDAMGDISKEDSPSHDKECDHCDHVEYCPVQQGKLGGVMSLID